MPEAIPTAIRQLWAEVAYDAQDRRDHSGDDGDDQQHQAADQPQPPLAAFDSSLDPLLASQLTPLALMATLFTNQQPAFPHLQRFLASAEKGDGLEAFEPGLRVILFGPCRQLSPCTSAQFLPAGTGAVTETVIGLPYSYSSMPGAGPEHPREPLVGVVGHFSRSRKKTRLTLCLPLALEGRDEATHQHTPSIHPVGLDNPKPSADGKNWVRLWVGL
jgi:hypothetical protein